MYKLTVIFGALLVLLGVACYLATGHEHPTSLIPSGFGLLLALCGFLARTPDVKKRMLWMHIAVTVGLLGFLGTLKAVWQTFEISRGVAFPHPVAVEEKAAMSLLCLLFVAFCVRSFINARRERVA